MPVMPDLFRRPPVFLLLILFLAGCGGDLPATVGTEASTRAATAPLWQHQLSVSADPSSGTLSVRDIIEAPTLATGMSFTLNSDLTLSVDGAPLTPQQVQGKIALYQLPPMPERRTITLEYSGAVASTDDCDWLHEHCRLLNQRGLYLDGGSHWYATSRDAMHAFSLETSLPESWVSLSQGERSSAGIWRETQPQDDIYLLAGPFKIYESVQSGRTAMVYLQTEDEVLANSYLEATHRYLREYSALIGAYPYRKFATVESFWETGWGMPSFTLLGPRVMRLPFILYTSLPHEILHNWWGNTVYIDPSRGNWAEGLTAYLSDHQSQLQRGSDAGYRRDTLQKYAVFSQNGRDFPLQAFRSRHDNTTQAVGYGKSLMLFHMLRQKLGESTFQKALQTLYNDYRFRRASFDDVRSSFEKAAGYSLSEFFEQWLQRTGAPRLAIIDVQQMAPGQIRLSLQQTQSEDAFSLEVPVLLQLASSTQVEKILPMSSREQSFELQTDEAVLSISVDPNFDVMRLPDPGELPATLNEQFAGSSSGILLPVADFALASAARPLLQQWFVENDTTPVWYDSHQALPQQGTLVLVNPSNATLGMLEGVVAPDSARPIDAASLNLDGQILPRATHASAIALKQGELTLILLDAPDISALTMLLGKIRHYGKQSYVAFDISNGRNVAKGQWNIINTALMRHLP